MKERGEPPKLNEFIPEEEIFILQNGEPVKKNIVDILNNKRAILFGLPGAYTSICSAQHLPGYINSYEKYVFIQRCGKTNETVLSR